VSDAKLDVERVRYQSGQTLTSIDLRTQVEGAAQLRWWHNRALHEPFGVADGLEVSEIQDADGRRLALVAPGVAHDAFGRELILCARQRALFPADVPRQTLLLRYPHAAERAQARRRHVGELAWMPTRRWNVRHGVPLAHTNAAGQFIVDAWNRPQARVLARPRIAAGTTLPGATSWKAWRPLEMGDGQDTPPGYQVAIDTSYAGFTQTPCYFAWMQGPNVDARGRILAACAHIESETPLGFVFCVWLPTILGARLIRESAGAQEVGSPFLAFARREGLYVRWLAVEPVDSTSRKD